MDYEKAYKEALERAKKLKAGFEGYNANVAIIEEIFPELRESGDERIRKNCIHFLELQKAHHADTTEIDDCIAYLEKQKEENDKRLERVEQHCKEVQELDAKMKSLRRKMYGDEQKEQKSILEVFGFKVGDAVRLKDGDGRKHIIKSFEEVKGIHGPDFYHVEFEDDSARDGIYPGEGYPNGYYTHMEHFDEELEPVSGSSEKPNYHAEWNEEDEDYLADVKAAVYDYFDEGYAEELYTWLKSLRPQSHWKPSEEQMEALYAVISQSGLPVQPLYNDLKKL